jgi:Ras-related protein Rab-1A
MMHQDSIPNDHHVTPHKKENNESLLHVKPKHIFKISVVGDAGVGKTSFIQSYVNGFPLMAMGSTLGVNFHALYVDIDSEISKVNIWDTAGQDRFKSIIQLYLKNIHGVVIIYDVYTRECKKYIKTWYDNIKAQNENVYISVACNKCDQLDSCSYYQKEKYNKNISIGKSFCESNGLSFFTMSVSKYENVTHVMNHLIYKIYENPDSLDLVETICRSESIDFRKREKRNHICC